MNHSTFSIVPLPSQVGGHAGVQTSEDGSLIFKPALPLEQQFYQTVISDPGFAPLQPFIPKFYGTLRLEGKIDTKSSNADAGITVTPIEDSKDVVKDK
jgi:1D-myo-inositol-tetrakisphosphate 5-kinase/inositol-polyphosphate multikinase